MPELVIHVPSYIGPSYIEESEDGWFCEWVQGITKADVEMQVQWAEMMGEPVDSILLEISTCDGGSTIEGFAIYNYLRGLNIPIRCRILALAASMAVPLALASDDGPEMDYTAQLMLHSATFNGGVYAETSVALRAQADRLDNTNQLLFDLLSARSGQPAEVVNGWLAIGKDTWLTATQAQAVGLCSNVIPLASKLTPVQADSVITARRSRATASMARTSRTTPTAKTSAPAAATSPAPMATTPKPTPRAAKPAAKAAAKPAQPQAREKNAFTRFMDWLEGQGGNEATANAGGETEPTATVESTELDNGAFLYHDGALAVDTAVFNDEALTEATADGEYDTKDAQVVTVAGGIVTALDADSSGAATGASTAATASWEKRFDALEAKLNTALTAKAALETENDRLRQQKPPLPQARAARANADAPDPKASASVKQPQEGAGTL